MVERFLLLEGDTFPSEWVALAAEKLEQGAVVVHPTETVHGFGCRWDSRAAHERIVRLKGREPGKAMLFLVPDTGWVERLAQGISPEAAALMQAFWPGPLTLVFNASGAAHERCPWLGETVALRRSPHPFTAKVVERLALPMVSTSLNRSGQPVPEDPVRFLTEVLPAELGDEPPKPRVELAVIESRAPGSGAGTGLPSSLVRPLSGGFELLRSGAVSAEEISRRTGLELRQRLG
ncbi:L-threonylcarbamoyladenylate synthase [bacterium]|nr:L-threonylcarbamoyladenylate synthase [bacterium]